METQEIGFFEIAVAIGIMVLWTGSATWANKLKGKYLDPYVLDKATHREKRQWAIQLTMIQFGFLGALAVLVVVAVSSAQTDLLIKVMQWALCLIVLVLVLALLAMWQYWKIGNKLSTYQRWNEEKKRDKLTKVWLFSDTGSLNSEVKERFWESGYSENELVKEGVGELQR